MRLLFIITVLSIFASCTNSSPKNQEINRNSDTITSKIKSSKNRETEENRFAAKWSNPVINPVGSDLGEYVRALFLTGQEELLWRFFWDENINSVPKKSPYEQLKNRNWGYEIDFTQIGWQEDSLHFTLYYKTNINNTTGTEQIKGLIKQDTARILLN